MWTNTLPAMLTAFRRQGVKAARIGKIVVAGALTLRQASMWKSLICASKWKIAAMPRSTLDKANLGMAAIFHFDAQISDFHIDLRIKMEDSSHAKINFRQSYRAGSIAKRTAKVLIMRKTNGKWLIEQE